MGVAQDFDRSERLTMAAVAAIVLAIVAIQLFLPESVGLGPIWLIPVVELLGLPVGALVTQRESMTRSRVRPLVAAYLVFLVVASVMNATLLFLGLLQGSDDSADVLLFAGFGVLIINVLSFALVYWWIDSGGPEARLTATADQRDFLFPQQGGATTWQPGLADYCFTAYTNIIAFSPTDTMPLTHRAKFLFTIQSGVSLVTILVTLSRAITLIP